MFRTSIYRRWVLIVSLLFFVGALGLYYGPALIELVKKPESLLQIVTKNKKWGVFLFIGIQILQIVIPPIPGNAVQVGGGYIFGPWLGALYLLIGALVGSTISFYSARKLGFPIVQHYFPPKKLEKLTEFIERSETDWAIVLAFFIPAFPKDLLTYAAGLTPISGRRFIFLGLLGRLPALFVSAAIGSGLRQGTYGQTALLALILALACLIGFWQREALWALAGASKTKVPRAERANKDD